jgi:hypothetical protein
LALDRSGVRRRWLGSRTSALCRCTDQNVVARIVVLEPAYAHVEEHACAVRRPRCRPSRMWCRTRSCSTQSSFGLEVNIHHRLLSPTGARPLTLLTRSQAMPDHLRKLLFRKLKLAPAGGIEMETSCQRRERPMLCHRHRSEEAL